MELSSILVAIVVILGATAVCVILFERLGFGSVLGFIVAGIAIGPYTPGPVASHNVDALQNVAELGVVLFLFAVGLEMRPERVWAMRRLLFGLGSAQMLVTAALVAGYAMLAASVSLETAIILGLGFALSSTAIIMTTLTERGTLTSTSGQTTFAVLMAQDLWVVPVMALIPILAHKAAGAGGMPAWQILLLALGVIAGIFVVGRYLLPIVLGYTASHRRMEAFGIVILLAVVGAALAVELVGISMTLGAFLMGMLLSASDYRYQIQATVEPFKGFLMGLFFVAVGMSIDVGAMLRDWSALIVHVPVVMLLKVAALTTLALAFGVGRAAAIRTGFHLSQVGEFAFVVIGAAAVAGLASPEGHALALLVVAATMILTPLMVKAGDALANRFETVPAVPGAAMAADLDRHVVVVGYDEVGQLICLLLERAGIPYIAFDHDIGPVRLGKKSGRNVHFGDMYSPVTQNAAGLGRAAAVYLTSGDMERAKAQAITLHRLYAHVDVYVRVRNFNDQDELRAKGIKHAGTGYIESTLVRGAALLKNLGVPEAGVHEIIEAFQSHDYAAVRGLPAAPETKRDAEPAS